MAYTNPKMSTLLRSGAEGRGDTLNNPSYLAHWEVAEPSMGLVTGGEAEDRTLTESMAAASILQAVSTYASLPRAVLPRPTPQHLVLFQRGGP